VNINFLDVFAGRREEVKSPLMIEDRAVEAEGESGMSVKRSRQQEPNLF
jgi:hypothetical protein